MAISCAVVMLFLSACGQTEKPEETVSSKQNSTVKYTETDYFAVPDEEFYNGENLEVSTIERNMDGRPAMYMLERGMDDTDQPYAQILEYSLNTKGEWDMNVLCQNSLTKRIKKEEQMISMPHIVRGDDGNLYALLQIGLTEEDEKWYDGRGGESGEGAGEEKEVQYSVLLIEEGKDSFRETRLQFDSEKQEEGYQKGAVTKFHVYEDGTPLLVFDNTSVFRFDIDNGMQTSANSTVPDRALERNVAYGKNEIIYYSSTAKLFGILDIDTMAVTGNFGEEVKESNRGREWYYDTRTEDSQIYAFNTSGLYRISEEGKKFVASLLSLENSFDALADKTLYDVLVDEKENVYLLVRREAEDSESYEKVWEYGLELYTPSESEPETTEMRNEYVNGIGC